MSKMVLKSIEFLSFTYQLRNVSENELVLWNIFLRQEYLLTIILNYLGANLLNLVLSQLI
jgi:hypothetical protein